MAMSLLPTFTLPRWVRVALFSSTYTGTVSAAISPADLGGIAADVDVAGTQTCIVAHRGVVDGGNQITAGCTVDGVAGNVQIVTGGVFVVAEFDAVSVYVVFEKGQAGNGVAADFVAGVIVGIQVFVLRVGLQLDA